MVDLVGTAIGAVAGREDAARFRATVVDRFPELGVADACAALVYVSEPVSVVAQVDRRASREKTTA